MKVHNFQILSETYTIFNSYDTLHTEASDVPSDIAITYCLQSRDISHQQVKWYDHAEASSVE
jgi:hypothetical protein